MKIKLGETKKEQRMIKSIKGRNRKENSKNYKENDKKRKKKRE